MPAFWVPSHAVAARVATFFFLLVAGPALADLPEVVERLKPSVVVVGTYQITRSPQFVMRGTGFVVGDGRQIATNAHVIEPPVDIGVGEKLMVLARTGASGAQQRPAQLALVDKAHDLALLRIEGQALPTLTLHDSPPVREGQSIAFTGFPIGGVLGFFSPVTHRGIISAITPIVLPGGNARDINARVISQLRSGSFDIYQLDATAYPGNSGGPLYEVERGEVVGIINMVLVKETKESVLSKPSAISYAVPVRHLRDLLNKDKP
ncbi:MAG TPA: serine protease [Accumulibacter sp.]|jgi:S1-C subfamily serine protease|nr:serine protease [Accumulibacter sp.]HQC79282.1 serine protease [Accumulibacter sp.]